MSCEPTLPDIAFFRQAGSLDDFRKFPGWQEPDLETLVGRMRARWQELAREGTASPPGSPATPAEPPRLDEIRVERDGRLFVVNGVIHGILGGGTGAYRELIRSTVAGAAEPLLFEAGFNHLYGGAGIDYTSIPDFAVLGFVDTCKKGIDAGRMFPLLLKDAVWEAFSLLPDDAPFHQLDQELRRGIDGILPTALEIEWDRRKPRRFFTLEDYPNLVRRSAFMAAFAEAWCAKNGRAACRLVVGDLHLTEVAWFLRRPGDVPADLRHLADACTSANPRVQTWLYLRRNLVHNLVGGMAGFLGFLPYFLVVLFGLHRLTGCAGAP
ncbi:MAG: hypothetical protein GX442_09860 [Candidatus Riflebacteria bacterium]|nr:hypothetical protein [Candidatus Riflebacteria bacterium]